MIDGAKKIKVLIVDDSAIVRKILSETIAAEPDMEVVGTAPDPFIARDKILRFDPDVLTLDIEMPRMDGLTFLKKLMRYHPMPVIVISSLGQSSCEASLEALRWGAVEVMLKPGGPYSIGDLRSSLGGKLRAAAAARIGRSGAAGVVKADSPASSLSPIAGSPHEGFREGAVIAIGASTGGTEAIREVLVQLPATTPGIVVTQHIPKVFSAAFADRLNRLCAIEVKEARDGDAVRAGQALVAPGDFHMLLEANRRPVSRAGAARPAGLLSAPFCRRDVRLSCRSRWEQGHRRSADGHGVGWSTGDVTNASSRSLDHCAG